MGESVQTMLEPDILSPSSSVPFETTITSASSLATHADTCIILIPVTNKHARRAGCLEVVE